MPYLSFYCFLPSRYGQSHVDMTLCSPGYLSFFYFLFFFIFSHALAGSARAGSRAGRKQREREGERERARESQAPDRPIDRRGDQPASPQPLAFSVPGQRASEDAMTQKRQATWATPFLWPAPQRIGPRRRWPWAGERRRAGKIRRCIPGGPQGAWNNAWNVHLPMVADARTQTLG